MEKSGHTPTSFVIAAPCNYPFNSPSNPNVSHVPCDIKATHFTLHPAALASVPSGIVLVRVRVLPRHELVSITRGRARDAAAVTQGGFGLLDWPIGMRNLASQRPEGRAGQINKLQKPQHSRAPTPKQTRPHETQRWQSGARACNNMQACPWTASS